LSRSPPPAPVSTPGTWTGSSCDNNEGTTLADVTPAAFTNSTNAPGSARCTAEAITNVPPAAKTTATSNTAASNPNDANCNTTRPGPASNTGANRTAKFTTPRCPTTTPFGRPVDPDLHITST